MEQPQWPDEKRDLPQHDPVIMALDESGYVIDPSFDYGAIEMPTVKENFHVENMTDDERLTFYIDWKDEDAYDLIVEKLGVDEIDEYTIEHLSILDENYADWLNEPIDPEHLGPYQFAGYSEYWMGVELLEQLGDEVGAELGLGLVQGDHPGSSFTGVRFDGDPDVLNAQLYRRGINLRLE